MSLTDESNRTMTTSNTTSGYYKSDNSNSESELSSKNTDDTSIDGESRAAELIKYNHEQSIDRLKYSCHRQQNAVRWMNDMSEKLDAVRNDDIKLSQQMEKMIDDLGYRFSKFGDRMDEELQTILNSLYEEVYRPNSSSQSLNECFNNYNELMQRLIPIRRKYEEIQYIKAHSSVPLENLANHQKLFSTLSHKIENLRWRWLMVTAAKTMSYGKSNDENIAKLLQVPRVLLYMMHQNTSNVYFEKIGFLFKRVVEIFNSISVENAVANQSDFKPVSFLESGKTTTRKHRSPLVPFQIIKASISKEGLSSLPTTTTSEKEDLSKLERLGPKDSCTLVPSENARPISISGESTKTN